MTELQDYSQILESGLVCKQFVDAAIEIKKAFRLVLPFINGRSELFTVEDSKLVCKVVLGGLASNRTRGFTLYVQFDSHRKGEIEYVLHGEDGVIEYSRTAEGTCRQIRETFDLLIKHLRHW